MVLKFFSRTLSGQVQSGNWAKEFEYKNQFLHVLNQTARFSNIREVILKISSTLIKPYKGFVPLFDGVSYFGQSIQIDGEPVGGVFAFPGC